MRRRIKKRGEKVEEKERMRRIRRSKDNKEWEKQKNDKETRRRRRQSKKKRRRSRRREEEKEEEEKKEELFGGKRRTRRRLRRRWRIKRMRGRHSDHLRQPAGPAAVWRSPPRAAGSHHVFPAQVLHHLDLVEVEGALEAVSCLELGWSGVGHALVVAGRRVVRVRVEH